MMQLFLTTVVCWLGLVQAAVETETVASSSTNLQSVTCPTNQFTFTALTEMVLIGRSQLLSVPEGRTLSTKFVSVYNGLTEQNCDAYFRRIAKLQLINMTNDQGELVDADEWQALTAYFSDNVTTSSDAITTTSIEKNAADRSLQSSLVEGGVNSTGTNKFGDDDDEKIRILYQVTGTCRNCPITSGGAFDLYDEAFRRQLLLSRLGDNSDISSPYYYSTRMLAVVEKDEHHSNETTVDDCQCVEGAEPIEPRAPGVQECVTFMNDQLAIVRDETAETERPLYQNLNLFDLIQLDDLTHLANEDTTTTSTTVATAASDSIGSSKMRMMPAMILLFLGVVTASTGFVLV